MSYTRIGDYAVFVLLLCTDRRAMLCVSYFFSNILHSLSYVSQRAYDIKDVILTSMRRYHVLYKSVRCVSARITPQSTSSSSDDTLSNSQGLGLSEYIINVVDISELKFCVRFLAQTVVQFRQRVFRIG